MRGKMRVERDMSSYPPLPETARDLSMPAFALGHGSDLAGKTGVTVVLCPAGVTAAAEVRGSATATRQFDSLVAAHHVAGRAHGLEPHPDHARPGVRSRAGPLR